jgi:hypothetical protein
MKQIFSVLALLVAVCGGAHAGPPSAGSAATERVLMIDPSSLPVAAGKVTLTIGALRRVNGVYTGDYKIKVVPYFYKNENGRLAIVVSDETLAAVSQGKIAAIKGTATTSGKGGHSRQIEATASPADLDHGLIRLSFAAGDRKMVFEPAYHFAGKGTAPGLAQTTEIKH